MKILKKSLKYFFLFSLFLSVGLWLYTKTLVPVYEGEIEIKNLSEEVKIHFDADWVHLRKSNTEPIIRIFAEADSQDIADKYALKIENEIKSISS